jgi:hypothetical protein
MFEQWDPVERDIAALVARFDVDAVPAAGVVPLFERLQRINRQVTAAMTLLARRIDEVEQWKRAGFASAAEFVAAKSGSSVAAARDVLATSSKLSALPVIEDALRAGKLSGSQAVAVADAAAAAPSVQARLVNDAQRSSLHELRHECLRVKAAADCDREVTRERIHRQRCVRAYTDGEGARNMRIRGPVDQVARIEATLQPFIDQEFERARKEGRREEREAYAFDALLRMSDAAAGGGHVGRQRSLRTTMLLRVDLEALKRGTVEGDELCEIPGVGPVAVSAARELLGESLLKLIVTRGVDVVNVTHLGRGPTEAQKIALLFQQPICIVEGCYRTRVEFDHRTPWTLVRNTRLDNLDPPCAHHHRLKTIFGWALVEGAGKRPMVPPEDPRHPSNKTEQPP